MSKVSGSIVPIPDKVNVNLTESNIKISGSNGEVSFSVHKDVELTVERDQLLIQNTDDSKQSKAMVTWNFWWKHGPVAFGERKLPMPWAGT